MNALEIATRLRREAQTIIYDRGLDAILQPYGRVLYTGSYAVDMMAWPDIDISMILEPDPRSLDAFFEIGKRIAEIPGTFRLNFFDNFVARSPGDEALPKGLYWGIRVQPEGCETPWKIDLWAVDAESIEKSKAWIARVRQALDEGTRRLIIEAKHSLLTPEGRTPILSGYHICEAILFKGLRTGDEIRSYLREQGIAGV